MTVTFADNDNLPGGCEKYYFKTMFSNTETILFNTTTQKNVDGIVEFKCLGFRS